MGGDLHVTRAEDRDDPDGAPITLDEWIAYVDACDDLRIDRDGSAIWMGHPHHEGAGVRFSFPGDHVAARQPDVATTTRLHEIAAALGAQVQGEDGEVLEAEPPRHDAGGRVVRLFRRR